MNCREEFEMHNPKPRYLMFIERDDIYIAPSMSPVKQIIAYLYVEDYRQFKLGWRSAEMAIGKTVSSGNK